MKIEFSSYDELMDFVQGFNRSNETCSDLTGDLRRAINDCESLTNSLSRVADVNADYVDRMRVLCLEKANENNNAKWGQVQEPPISEVQKERTFFLECLRKLYSERDSIRSKGDFITTCVGVKKIDNIKFHRTLTGEGLRDSKEFVEKYLDDDFVKNMIGQQDD